MAYIYKITNKINDKVYIGKTEFSIEKRWKEHCRDSIKKEEKNRPLYKAFNKYGIENFKIDLIEETNDPEEREKYWIEYYGSFKYGYNATMGGDGKRYCDYDLIYTLYNEGLNIKEIANILDYSTDTCSNVLSQYGVTKKEKLRRGHIEQCKIVIQLDKKTEEILNIFSSIAEAYNFLGKQHSGHIAEVCTGKRKTAYGYKWKYGK